MIHLKTLLIFSLCVLVGSANALVPACDRKPLALVEGIEDALAKPCEEITLGDLENITELSIDNDISYLNADSFAGMNHLQSLTFEDSYFQDIDDDFKENFSQALQVLKTLPLKRLIFNKYLTLGNYLSGFNELEELKVDFSDPVTNNFFLGLPKLKKLDVESTDQLPVDLLRSNSSLESLRVSTFKNLISLDNLSNLKELEVEKASANHLSGESLAPLTSLESVTLYLSKDDGDASDTNLAIGFFLNKPKLAKIKLNQSKNIPQDLLSSRGAGSLPTTLIIEDTNFRRFPAGFFDGAVIERLELTACPIAEFEKTRLRNLFGDKFIFNEWWPEIMKP